MLRRSRIATVIASLAAVSLAAPPAMASHRNWGGWGGWGGYHRHRDRIDTGDVLAGILIIGGIAAVASAASKANKDKYRDRDRDYRYPDQRYPSREGDEASRDYAGKDESREDWRGSADLDAAVDRCVEEVSRGSARIDQVESVNRDGEGWRVEGKMSGGADFSCTVDADGRIRNVNIDGRAI